MIILILSSVKQKKDRGFLQFYRRKHKSMPLMGFLKRIFSFRLTHLYHRFHSSYLLTEKQLKIEATTCNEKSLIRAKRNGWSSSCLLSKWGRKGSDFYCACSKACCSMEAYFFDWVVFRTVFFSSTRQSKWSEPPLRLRVLLVPWPELLGKQYWRQPPTMKRPRTTMTTTKKRMMLARFVLLIVTFPSAPPGSGAYCGWTAGTGTWSCAVEGKENFEIVLVNIFHQCVSFEEEIQKNCEADRVPCF